MTSQHTFSSILLLCVLYTAAHDANVVSVPVWMDLECGPSWESDFYLNLC